MVTYFNFVYSCKEMMGISKLYMHIFLAEQPGELFLREQLFENHLIYLFLLSALLVGAVKWVYPEMFQFVFQSLFRKASLASSTLREDTNALKKASFLLLINYFTIAGTIAYMIGVYYSITDKELLVFVPFIYYIFLHFGLFITGVLVGESQRLRENKKLIDFIHQFAGLLLLPIGLAWLLNTEYSVKMINILLIVVGLILLIRIFKGFICAIQNKISWYYIILYLCTLEIWPLLILVDFWAVK